MSEPEEATPPQEDATQTLCPTRLEGSDLARCLELYTQAGWNQTAADWEFFMSMQWAKGYRQDGRIVGSTVNVELSDEFAWIAMVLVDQS